MHFLFMSLANFSSLEVSGIYTDLMNELVKEGHTVDIISPVEKRFKCDNDYIVGNGYRIIKPRIGNITNTPFIQKGISLLTLQQTIINALDTKLSDVHYDCFILATPPNLDKLAAYVKTKYNTKVYLLLKDIWPESLLDLKVPGGELVKKLVFWYYRREEVRLFKTCDFIGCMSQANVDYIVEKNPYLNPAIVHINPNSIYSHDIVSLTASEKEAIKDKYNIPKDKLCLVYGGTLGVGQNVPFIVECIKACRDLDCNFVISGKGVQYHCLDEFYKKEQPANLTLINGLPKQEYDKLMQSCDFGLVFLRYSATTPNFPSRILTYMDYSLPIISCTDKCADVNAVIEEGKFGKGCYSNNAEEFKRTVASLLKTNNSEMGVNGKIYLESKFTPEVSVQRIVDSLR